MSLGCPLCAFGLAGMPKKKMCDTWRIVYFYYVKLQNTIEFTNNIFAIMSAFYQTNETIYVCSFGVLTSKGPKFQIGLLGITNA